MDERGDLLSLVAMWSIMMIAMMLPATLPWIAAAGTRFVAGYSLVWLAFGVVAATVQWRFGSVPANIAVPVVAAATIYELTPLKRFFLRSCSNRIDAVTARSALLVGLKQGVSCAGCCWLLMATLFAVGVANLAWMIALTIFIVGQRFFSYARERGRNSAIVSMTLS